MSDETAPLRLWWATNTISVAVAIALEESGLPYAAERVDFARAEQRGEAYRALNPKGRVPLLEAEGRLLTETGAILDYIAACAPQAGLVPSDPFDAAQMRSVMYYLASTMHPNHAHMRRGERWATHASSIEDMAAKTPENMTENAGFIENHCLAGRFLLGDRPTLADCYLFVVATWLEGDNVDMAPFPKIRAFREAMEQRASVRAVRARGMLK